MEWTDMKYNLSAVFEQLLESLKLAFRHEISDRDAVFYDKDGSPFSVVKMGETAPWNFIVVEYHDDGEDGDAFYPEDYNSFNDFLDDILQEINIGKVA